MNLTNMKVSSKTVILSPYIFPVLAEMKMCQFMFWHDMGCVTTVLISTALPLTYINCVFGGMANPTSASPLLYPFPLHSTCWHKWSISTTWTNFTNRQWLQLYIAESLLFYFFVVHISFFAWSTWYKRGLLFGAQCIIVHWPNTMDAVVSSYVTWFSVHLLI